MYWDHYNLRTVELQKKYPLNFRMWDISEFNSSNGKNSILDFIKFEFKRSTDMSLKLNKHSYKTTILKKIKNWF